jgi:hypothetical protein
VNKAQIIENAEQHLRAVGIPSAGWQWQPLQAQLLVVLGGQIRSFTLRSGISQREFSYHMGRIAGLAEAAKKNRVARVRDH